MLKVLCLLYIRDRNYWCYGQFVAGVIMLNAPVITIEQEDVIVRSD
jgi:hypothetical protein